MITHRQEQNLQAQDTNCATSNLASRKEQPGKRTGNGRERQGESSFPFTCHLWSQQVAKKYPSSLPPPGAFSASPSGREPRIWRPSLHLSGPSCWSSPGRSQSSRGLFRVAGPRHTWVCAAPSSCGRKVCSDIKQSVSVTVPEAAGMMSGPHKSGG